MLVRTKTIIHSSVRLFHAVPSVTRTIRIGPLLTRARGICDAQPPKPTEDPDVVIPDCVHSLEWVLESPPPTHQFEEPPIVVETFGPVDPYH
uniref:AlNc14C146G7388 protein n=1 Tax=Albugo laibachii Nc14 TaxID=890382 RepID=F0WLK1_9STRA|nr:AlNc14C146G7388 [Albugo laibachii Nc14]CCA24232.1 AlNc14C228G9252 [Albugo laibachii Nc14]|eukprot:CCA24232.1 AlNc14C228G9252 [Albugo laibachii Nc14]